MHTHFSFWCLCEGRCCDDHEDEGTTYIGAWDVRPEAITLRYGILSGALLIRSFLVHSDTEYRPIEFPVSHLLQNLDQSGAFRATTLFTIGWRPVHNFLLMVCLLFDNRWCMLNMWLMNYPWYSTLEFILIGLTCLWNTCLCLLILLPCNGEFLNCKFADTVTIDFCFRARLFEICNLFQILKYRYRKVSTMQIGNDIKVPILLTKFCNLYVSRA